MKRGDLIKISKNAKYKGQFMNWTEEHTGKALLKAGTKLYHSSNKRINEFLTKETCFFFNVTAPGYTYCLLLDEDVEVNVYDDEVRLMLTENMKMYYIGEKKYSHFQPYNEKYPQFGECVYKDNYLKEFQVDRSLFLEDIVVG